VASLHTHDATLVVAHVFPSIDASINRSTVLEAEPQNRLHKRQ